MSELSIFIRYKRGERDRFLLVKHKVVEEQISIPVIKDNEVLHNSFEFLSEYVNKLNNVIYEYRFNYGYYFN